MSNSTPRRTAPAGLDREPNHNAAIYGSTLPLIIIASIAVVLRILIRLMRGRPKLECDDLFSAVALVFALGTASCCYVGIPYGVGYHTSSLTSDEVVAVWKVMYSQMMLYATSVTLTKFSALLFYRRLFDFTWLFWAGLFLVSSYWVTALVTINVGCHPVDYLWERWADDGAQGVCMIDVLTFFFANGIWAMVIDVIILCMPIPCCLKLHMPPRERAAVIGILLVGSGVCVASIMRILSLHALRTSSDLPWAAGNVALWSSIEPSMAVICLCLPTFAPFLRCWYWSLCARASHGRPSASLGRTPESASTHAEAAKRDRLAFQASLHRRAWGPLDGIDDLADLTYHGRLRDDDEVELTTTISGPVTLRAGDGGSSVRDKSFEAARSPGPERDDVIQVERGLEWHASPVEEKAPTPMWLSPGWGR